MDAKAFITLVSSRITKLIKAFLKARMSKYPLGFEKWTNNTEKLKSMGPCRLCPHGVIVVGLVCQ